MNQEQNNAVTETEEKRICKKCEKRLPNKSYFCMYCGTDNAPTSIQVEYEKANNESLKKYTMIQTKKQSVLWYIIFVLLIIDVIMINVTLMLNQDNAHRKVNSVHFEKYEKTFYLGDESYLALKDNKLRVIGANRIKYSNINNEITKYEIIDVQEVYDFIDDKIIYAMDEKNRIYKIEEDEITQITTEEKFTDVYHYLNDKKLNCHENVEYVVLEDGVYYYDQQMNEVKYVEKGKYTSNGESYCQTYPRRTALAADDINLENPELIYQSDDGYEIILKSNKEILFIDRGQITSRLTEIEINGKTIKVEDIKKMVYIDGDLLIIDKSDNFHSTVEEYDSYDDESSLNLSLGVEDESKTDLIILLVVFLIDLILLYKMSDNHAFSKIMSLSGMIMIELILYLVFKAGGIDVGSGQLFMLLLEILFIIFLYVIIASTIIVQMSELTIKLLDLVRFRNIFSYIFVLVAVASLFLNIMTSGNNGVFFAVFMLGTFWSYFTETEDIDIDLFVTPSSYVPILVLSIVNIILYFALLDIFKISNYFVMLFLVAVMFAIYLAARPELAKKELTGKSIKSLLVMIMSLVATFITTLFSMNLFTVLQKDDGTIMKAVLALGFKYLLYLVVTFAVLVIISSILRILHKIIKTMSKNTNTVVQYLMFSVISLILFTIIIYFYPEIVNIIDVGVSNIFTTIVK